MVSRDVQLIDNAGTVRIDRLLLGVERRRRLAALAEAHPAADPGAEVVVDDEVFPIRRRAELQRFEAERDGDEPARPDEARVNPRQGDAADDLTDAHVPAPPGCRPR